MGTKPKKPKLIYDTDTFDQSRTSSIKLRYYDGSYVTDFTSMALDIQWSGNKNDAFRCLAINLLMGADVEQIDFVPAIGHQVRLYSGSTELFRGVVTEIQRTGDGKASITVYDELWYATKNTIDFIVTGGMTASQAIKAICKKYGLAYGSIADTKYKFGRKRFFKRSIAEIFDTLLWEVYQSTGRKYMLEVRGGKIVLAQVIPQALRFRVERGRNLKGITATASIDGMATQVYVTGGEDEEKGLKVTRKDASGIKRYGVLQYAEHRSNIRKAGDLYKYADRMLARHKRPTRTLTVQAIGNFSVKCGDVVYVSDRATGVKGRYWVTADTHTISGTGVHVMDLDLAKTWNLEVSNYEPPSEPSNNTSTPSGDDAAIGTRAPYKYLTQFVRKYETSNAGSTSIYNDSKYGGLSYGFYQMASRAGTPQDFVRWLSNRDDEIYERLNVKLGSVSQVNGAFAKEWLAVAQRYKSRFTELEHAYAKEHYYDKAYRGIKERIGVKITSRSWAMQAALLSTAIQFGVGSVGSAKGAIPIFSNTYKKGISDEAWLRAIYADKTQRFPVTKTRFTNELADALFMLNKQQAAISRSKPEPKPSNVSKTATREKIVKIARSKKGRLKYNLAGGNPLLSGSNVGDCSDFVQYVFKQAGVPGTVPNYTPAIWGKYTKINRSSARPGDLVLFSGTIPGRSKGTPSHVGIVSGDGKMVNLQSYGCKEEFYGSGYWGDYLLGFVRVLD